MNVIDCFILNVFILHSQGTWAVELNEFECVSHENRAWYIDCAYLFSAAKFSRTVSANAELVSQQTQLIRFPAILKGTDRIHYMLIKRTLIKHAITAGGHLHAS